MNTIATDKPAQPFTENMTYDDVVVAWQDILRISAGRENEEGSDVVALIRSTLLILGQLQFEVMGKSETTLPSEKPTTPSDDQTAAFKAQVVEDARRIASLKMPFALVMRALNYQHMSFSMQALLKAGGESAFVELYEDETGLSVMFHPPEVQ